MAVNCDTGFVQAWNTGSWHSDCKRDRDERRRTPEDPLRPAPEQILSTAWRLAMNATADTLAPHTPATRSGRIFGRSAAFAMSALAVLLGSAAWAHGDVTPQAVDTSTLPKVGTEWRSENPYRGNAEALKVGTSAFNQNCARCHGLEAISGGIAPDLRRLDNDCATIKDPAKRAACVKDNDDYFLTTVRHGRTRNGAVYMPPFEGTFDQEAIWAIKTYLESRREKPF
jgi:cytochrome c-550 PedF